MDGYSHPAAVQQRAADTDEVPRMSTFRGPQVCDLAGCTYRQLDWWARHRTVVPSVADADGCGTQRLYSADDVRALRAVAALSRLGAKQDVLARAAHAVRAADDTDTHLVVTPTEAATWPIDCIPTGEAAVWLLDLVTLGAHRHATIQPAADLVGVT